MARRMQPRGSMKHTLFACMLLTCLALSSRADAQTAEPAAPLVLEVPFSSAEPPMLSVERDRSERFSPARLERARRLRISGFVLVAASLTTVAIGTAVGIGSGSSCDILDPGSSCGFVDRHTLGAVTTSIFAAPFLISGLSMITAGYVIKRRAGRAMQLEASANQLTIHF
jgi:hypothetical protein